MEAVTPEPMAPVQLIRKRIEIGALRKSLVKRGIKDGNLRKARAEDVARGRNALQIPRIVKGREIDAVLNALEHTVIDQCRFLEHLSAVYHTMSDRMYVSRSFDFFHA